MDLRRWRGDLDATLVESTETLPEILIIGDRLNTSNGSVHAALMDERWDDLTAIASSQIENGATALDLCAASSGDCELEHVARLAESASALPFVPCIGTREATIVRALADNSRPKILNCFSGLTTPRAEMLSAISDAQPLAVIAVCIDDAGTKVTAEHRLDVAKRLYDQLSTIGIAPAQIIFDPVTMPASCGDEAEEVTFETSRLIRESFPESRVLSVVSNYSFGMAQKREHEQEFAAKAKAAGATVFLLNALDPILCRIARGEE